MIHNLLHNATLGRRELLSSLTTGLVVAGMPKSILAQSVTNAMNNLETMTWCACTVNCSARCPLRVYSRNGKIIRIEPENTGADSCAMPNAVPHIRPCARGRSYKQRFYAPERLKYPMKRVGKRGEGNFERISWEEAINTVCKALKHTIQTYGNEAIYINANTGTYQMVSGRNCQRRLMNILGGTLDAHGTYSLAMIRKAYPYTFGIDGWGSMMSEAANAKLYVAFGNNPYVLRTSGASHSWELECVRTNAKPKVILIDPIYTDTALGKEDLWVPIRIGTDAALCEAIAHELIVNNWVDQQFLDKYCVGYDEKTLPPSAPKGSDYKSYILGQGADGVEKTPERAAIITGVPATTIRQLAKEMHEAKPCFISQGWGPQRQSNGEQTSRAIAMMPILLGQIGLPGTNHGGREGDSNMKEQWLPTGKNPVKVKIPMFMWTDAVDHGEQMTALHDGIEGADKLKVGIKFLWNQHSNAVAGTHSDHWKTTKILQDESKCEFVLVVDNVMSATAKFADILLPDVMAPELDDICADGYSTGSSNFLIAMQKAVEPQWEQKSSWKICRLIAKGMGVEDKYTEGRTYQEWIRWCYEKTREKHPQAFPSFEEFWKKGIVKIPGLKANDTVILKKFRDDPEKNPLKTPSGKIEIYSERLDKIGKTWELEREGLITPLPQYVEPDEGPNSPHAEKYPLQCYGFHSHGHANSAYGNVDWLHELHPDQLWINPVDAQARNIKDGDLVQVFNDRGICELTAKVSERIFPGVCGFPQGGWFKPDSRGIDIGPSFNTLTTLKPSPLAKGNPQHTNLVQVRLATRA